MQSHFIESLLMNIPVYKPTLGEKEKQYVMNCLDSSWISSKGEYISLFEKGFSNAIGVNHSASVCNGTVALHLALLALGIGAGDEVIVPTLTYIASVNAIKYTGAKPVFVDSLSDTWQMDPNDVKRKITSKTKAIMVVHLYGHPCDMDVIMAISKQFNLYVVEDCAEAFGSAYKEKRVGGIGHVSAFSFFGNKTITTGEGGMLCTNDPEIHKRAFHLKGQGLAPNRQYWHDVIGYNYRMTNICAAIGLAQLERAEEFIAKKQQIAKWYSEELAGLPIGMQKDAPDISNTYWMVSILTSTQTQRDGLRKYLEINGVETRPLFFPVHEMPMYLSGSEAFPVAEDLSSRGINLPSYPELTLENIKFIASKIRGYLLEFKEY